MPLGGGTSSRRAGIRALPELHPSKAGLEVLSGRILRARNPGLKPWAMVYSRFAARSDRVLDYHESSLRG